MATASYQQTNFLGGEKSKFAQGRTDRPDYRSGMNVCLNGLPTEPGTWVRRPGFLFLATSHFGQVCKLLTFTLQGAVPYVMELTNGILRFFNNEQLVATNDGQAIVSISTATPAVVQTATAHGWSTNDTVELVNTNVVELLHRQVVITVIDATHFSLIDHFLGPVDGSQLTAFAAGSVLRVLRINTDYLAAELQDIRSIQAENISVVLHAVHPPRRLTATAQPTSTRFAEFSLDTPTLVDGPYLDPDGTTLTPAGTASPVTFTQTGALVNNGAGFGASDVGRLVRVFSEPPAWPGAGTGLAGDIVSFGGGYWIQQVNATASPPGAIGQVATTVRGQIVRSDASIAGIPSATTATPQWLPLTVGAAASWVWGSITSVGGTQQITVTLSRNLVSTAVITAWRLGVYGGPNGYPTCGCYHEGRLWLAGAVANRIDASNSNDIFNFAPTLTDGTVLDSSAIAAVFNASDVNTIYWMASDERGIICGSKGGEWLVAASALNNPLTPSNIQAHRVTTNGSANIEPRRTEHTLAVVQKFKRKVLEYFADVFSGRFSAPNLSADWKHLTKAGIEEIVYQQELVPTIWMRMGDGSLVGATYKRESLSSSQGPQINGAHRHVLGSGRVVESMTLGGSIGGVNDSLIIATNDPVTNVRHIEVLTDILDEGSVLVQAVYLDDCVFPTIATTAPVTGPYGGLTLAGLWHLNGKTVTAWIAGLDCGDHAVANGEITIPYGDGISAGTADGLFTADLVHSFNDNPRAVVGFTYTSQGQIVRPHSPQETGARNGPGFMKLRRTNWFGFQLEGAVTGSISFGTDFSALQAAEFKKPGGRPYTKLEQFTGIFRDTGSDSDSFDSMICWQVTRPYPANMVALGGALETKDI